MLKILDKDGNGTVDVEDGSVTLPSRRKRRARRNSNSSLTISSRKFPRIFPNLRRLKRQRRRQRKRQHRQRHCLLLHQHQAAPAKNECSRKTLLRLLQCSSLPTW